jgi:PAS domain S-box-containing protein
VRARNEHIYLPRKGLLSIHLFSILLSPFLPATLLAKLARFVTPMDLGIRVPGKATQMTSDHAPSPHSLHLPQRVSDRFGVLPNFFQLCHETPEVTEKLWGFAEAAYLDNPLPSVFKERLFVNLSRFCAVRYCVARHVGFLIGLGRPSGDKAARTESVADVVKLLKRRLPRGLELAARLSLCSTWTAPLAEVPTADTPGEDAIFAFSSHVFLQTADAPSCLDALERLLGAVRLQYLLLFLSFVRASHYWTKVHPEIQFEDDIKRLLATHEVLASCIIDDPESDKNTVTQSILDELPALRLRADKAIGLLAAIVDSSDDAIVSKTLEGVVTSWNRGAERLFGYSASEAAGQHISILIPRDRLDEETNILDRIRKGERIEHFDTIRVRKDGTTLDISLTISPIRDAAGQIIGASKIARDITARKRMERELHESEQRFRALAGALDTQVQFRTQELERRNAEILQQSEQLRGLSVSLMRAQDEERRRIARELHDSAGQILAALGMSVGGLKIIGNHDSAQFLKTIKETEDLIQDLTREIRTTSYLLHPPLLDEVGLLSAIRWYTDGLSERSGLRIELNAPDKFERLAPETELAIFRLVQECLTNIHRHSGSKTAVIRIVRERDKVCVQVVDHGRGISPERLAEVQSRAVGVGVSGMRERVRQCQGELTIDSNTLGTRITATFPDTMREPDKPVTISRYGGE